MSNQPASRETPASRPLPLEGVKVVDFSWVVVGPSTCSFLANHGAEVIRVESLSHGDVNRAQPPMKDGIRGVNRSGIYATYNPDKYGMSLNLIHPKGLEVARRLTAWADVVVEGFRPGTMKKLGLGYEDICKTNPQVIMVSTSMQGQTGPAATIAGFGNDLIATIGLAHLTGWPDKAPMTMGVTAYTDHLAPPIGVVAIMAALSTRRSTHKGQWIDLSQMETGLHFMRPELMRYSINGQVGIRRGNAHDWAAPHAAYRCKGHDRWCAVSVFSDEEFAALRRSTGDPRWAGDGRFDSVLDRKRNEDEMNKLVEAWTVEQSAEATADLLQKAGIAAGLVKNGRDLLDDPQLNFRGHYLRLEHKEMGNCAYEAPPVLLSETPARLRRAAPCFGEHTEHICTRVLGMPDEEFLDCLASGAFS